MSADPDAQGRSVVKRWTRLQCTWCTSRATHRLLSGGVGMAWGCDAHKWRWLNGEEM